MTKNILVSLFLVCLSFSQISLAEDTECTDLLASKMSQGLKTLITDGEELISATLITLPTPPAFDPNNIPMTDFRSLVDPNAALAVPFQMALNQYNAMGKTLQLLGLEVVNTPGNIPFIHVSGSAKNITKALALNNIAWAGLIPSIVAHQKIKTKYTVPSSDIREAKAHFRDLVLPSINGASGIGIGDQTLRVYVDKAEVAAQLPDLFEGFRIEPVMTGVIRPQINLSSLVPVTQTIPEHFKKLDSKSMHVFMSAADTDFFSGIMKVARDESSRSKLNAVLDELKKAGFEVHSEIPSVGIFTIRATKAHISILLARDEVKRIEFSQELHPEEN